MYYWNTFASVMITRRNYLRWNNNFAVARPSTFASRMSVSFLFTSLSNVWAYKRSLIVPRHFYMASAFEKGWAPELFNILDIRRCFFLSYIVVNITLQLEKSKNVLSLIISKWNAEARLKCRDRTETRPVKESSL